MPRVASDNKLTPSKSASVQLEANGAAAAADAGPAPSPLGPSRRASAAGGAEDAATHANGGAHSSDSSSLSSGSGSSSGSPVQGAPGALAGAASAPRPGAHQRSSSSGGLLPRPSSGVVTLQQRQVEQELIYEKLPTDIAERCGAAVARHARSALAPPLLGRDLRHVHRAGAFAHVLPVPQPCPHKPHGGPSVLSPSPPCPLHFLAHSCAGLCCSWTRSWAPAARRRAPSRCGARLQAGCMPGCMGQASWGSGRGDMHACF